MDRPRYAVLGSGSTANAYIFEYRGTAVVVDNGFSAREFLRRACEAGFNPETIKLILLTHVHGDHLRGVSTLSRKLGVPVALHEKLSLREWVPKGVHSRVSLVPGVVLPAGPFEILPFLSSHDAPFSMNFHITAGEEAFTLITDTGRVLPEMDELARRSTVLFLEANYAETMLLNGPYPEDIKQRILSEHGHLSNADAVNFLNHLAATGAVLPEMVYFCHLSGTNNSSAVLKEYLRLHLDPRLRTRVCEKGELCLP